MFIVLVAGVLMALAPSMDAELLMRIPLPGVESGSLWLLAMTLALITAGVLCSARLAQHGQWLFVGFLSLVVGAELVLRWVAAPAELLRPFDGTLIALFAGIGFGRLTPRYSVPFTVAALALLVSSDLLLVQGGFSRVAAHVAADVLPAFLALWLAVHSERQLRTYLHDAESDALTGLLNRRGWDEHARNTLVESARARKPASVVLVDLDTFKSVNDQFGHAAGDEILQRIGSALRARVPEPDGVVARLGGDEFAMALYDCPAGTAERTATALLADIRALPYRPTIDGSDRALTASVGIVEQPPGRVLPLADTLARADALMYAAKRAGGDRVADAECEPDHRSGASVVGAGNGRA